MPFRSKAQKKYLYANHPEIAKRFEKETPKNVRLPEKTVKKVKGVVNPIQPKWG